MNAAANSVGLHDPGEQSALMHFLPTFSASIAFQKEGLASTSRVERQAFAAALRSRATAETPPIRRILLR
jgi:hypothetical protein